MDLEERTLEEMKKDCERCGTRLTEAEIASTIDIGEDTFLCAICASENLSSQEEDEGYES